MNNELIMTAVILAAMPAFAQAQTINPQRGFYVGVGGGADWLLGSTTSNGTTVTSSTGWAVGGKVGYDFVGPRVELESGYGQVPTNINIPGTALNNKAGQLTVMANALYDFTPASVLTPISARVPV
jgi:OmpA-OmpF porin, OOP family